MKNLKKIFKIITTILSKFSSLDGIKIVDEKKYNKPVKIIFAKDDQVLGAKLNNEFIELMEKKTAFEPEVFFVEGGHNGTGWYGQCVKEIGQV